MKYILIMAFLFSAFAPMGNQVAASTPSYDCTKASRMDELLICQDDALAALDLKISDAYRSLRQASGQADLVADQRRWLSSRSSVCNLPSLQITAPVQRQQASECLTSFLSDRLSLLQKLKLASDQSSVQAGSPTNTSTPDKISPSREKVLPSPQSVASDAKEVKKLDESADVRTNSALENEVLRTNYCAGYLTALADRFENLSGDLGKFAGSAKGTAQGLSVESSIILNRNSDDRIELARLTALVDDGVKNGGQRAASDLDEFKRGNDGATADSSKWFRQAVECAQLKLNFSTQSHRPADSASEVNIPAVKPATGQNKNGEILDAISNLPVSVSCSEMNCDDPDALIHRLLTMSAKIIEMSRKYVLPKDATKNILIVDYSKDCQKEAYGYLSDMKKSRDDDTEVRDMGGVELNYKTFLMSLRANLQNNNACQISLEMFRQAVR